MRSETPEAIDTLLSTPLVTLAGAQCEYIIQQVREFEASLEPGFEAAFAVSCPLGLTVARSISYQNPYLIYFYGECEGAPVRVIQHMSQLNFALVAVPVLPDSPPRRIGFSAPL